MKAVLAYSGGLDTSVCLRLLQEKYGCEVVTVVVDVGIAKEDIEEAEEKANVLGITKHYTIDGKKEFAKDYVFRSIKANGSYEGYPLSTALARPLIASKVVEIAKKEGADALAHGATGKGNDQFRFDGVFRACAPEMKIIAPIRELDFTRKESIEYAKKNDIPVPVEVEKPYSIDENLWGRSIEGGILEDTGVVPPEEVYRWTKIEDGGSETLVVEFENGVPVAVNGRKLGPVELISDVSTKAGRRGIGRIDIVEDRILGMKVRGIYECPAAVVLIGAHRQLEQLVLTREELRFKEKVDSLWSELVYKGMWEDALKKDLEGFIEETQTRVGGEVKLKLEHGACLTLSRSSSYALFDAAAASFDEKMQK